MTINLNHVANQVTTTGSNTNLPLVFQSKGTGAIDLAAGSSGVNISNGGTVTALTRTSGGSNYTSSPTVTISAPTTAGGVQATATVPIGFPNVSIVSGGTGYSVNDVVTVVGGTFTSAGFLTVTSVSGGVITGVSIGGGYGNYSVAPANPVSVTGGTGTGATFNLTGWTINTNFTITNAGSGYVEQPTVSFSGGGGSGAAAIATVGSNAVLTALGSVLSLNTARGTALQISSYGSSMVNSYAVFGSSSFSPAILEARGSDTNISAAVSSKGTGNVQFYTNNFSNGTGLEQLRVSHTASAVNYVQVTGSATGSNPTISAQGSDSTIPLNITAKGGQPVYLVNGSGNGLRVYGGTNYFNMAGAGAGSAPSISAIGSDTNIDLTLTTKGTGSVNLATGNGTQFKVIDNTTPTVIWQAFGTGGNAVLRASGAGLIQSGGATPIGFHTNSGTPQFNIAHTASAVNYVQVTGAATGGAPTISMQGSDANVNLNLQSKGTGYLNVLNNRTNYFQFYGGNTGQSPTMYVWGTDTNIDLNLTTKGTGAVNLNTGGGLQVKVTDTASAVNYLQMSGAIVSNYPVINAVGSDTNVGLILRAKGTPAGPGFRIESNGGGNVCAAVQMSVSSPVNYPYLQPAATGSAPSFTANGSDANIDLALTPKGTGNVVIGSAGLLVGTTTTSLVTGISAAKLSISGSGDGLTVLSGSGNDTINVAKSGTPSGTWVGFFAANGTGYGNITVNGAGTAYNTTSDYRLKNIDGPLVGAKDFIMALKPKQGTWKADGSKFVGFVADEFQQVSPTSVTGEKDAVDEEGKPIYQTMQASSSEVMANLIALVQEQQTLIENLTKRIDALK